MDGLAIEVSLPVSGKCRIKTKSKTKTYCPDTKFSDLANPAAGIQRKQISSLFSPSTLRKITPAKQKTNKQNYRAKERKVQEQTKVLWNASTFRKQVYYRSIFIVPKREGKISSWIKHLRTCSFEPSTNTWTSMSPSMGTSQPVWVNLFGTEF